MASEREDPYEIGRALGIRDPDTLEQWVQSYAPAPPGQEAAVGLHKGANGGGSPITPLAQAGTAAVQNVRDVGQKQHDLDEKSIAGMRKVAGPTVSGAVDRATDSVKKQAASVTADDQRRAAAAYSIGGVPMAVAALAGVGRPKDSEGDGAQFGPPTDPRIGATPLEAPDQWDHSSAGGLRMVDSGGRRPASWQVQEGLDVPDALIDSYDRANGVTRRGIASETQAGENEAARDMAYFDALEREQQARALRLKAKAEDQARMMDAHVDKLNELTQAARADKLDSTHFFTGHGAAGGFAASIAYALGAIGSALTKQENPVLEFIRGDINDQKENAARNRQSIADQRSLLGQMAKTFEDERLGESAYTIAALEAAKSRMAKITSASKIEAVRARGLLQMGALDKLIANEHGKFWELAQDKVVRHDVNAPPTFLGGSGGGSKDKPIDPLFVPTGPNGEGFNARSEKEAQAARGVVTAEQDIVPLLEQLKVLRKKTNVAERYANKSNIYESEDMARIKSLQAQVALKLRELSATSPGAMDKGMQELAGEIQGNWASTQGHPEAAADAFIASIKRQKDSLMRGQGAQAQRQKLTLDAKGDVTTKTRGQPSFAAPKPETPKTFKEAK